MITANVMYELYVDKINMAVKTIEKDVRKLTVNKKPYLTYFKDEKFNLPNSIDYDLLIRGEQPLIKYPNKQEVYINFQITNYNKLIRTLNTKIEEFKNLKKTILNIEVYRYILKYFNNAIVDAIIYNNYTYYNYYLGTLKVVGYKDNKLRINWYETLKNKKALLDKGEIPFSQIDYKIALKENKEYNGKHYLVYFSEDTLWFDWRYNYIPPILMQNMRNYIFMAYRGKNSSTQKLNIHKNSLTKEEFKNKYYGDESN